jgi:microcystin degradation protein MlrC
MKRALLITVALFIAITFLAADLSFAQRLTGKLDGVVTDEEGIQIPMSKKKDTNSGNAFVACMSHETNSFSPIPTTLESFKDTFYFEPGKESDTGFLKKIMGVGRIISSFENLGYNVALGPITFAGPGGPLSRKDYEQLRSEILSHLKRAGKVDAVGLFLHGAQIAVGYEDCEGDLVKHIRQIVGQHVPIGLLLDLHADVTQQLIKDATIVIGCKEYPHTDFDDRAEELVALIHKTKRGEINPAMVRRHVPMISFFHTTTEPMLSLLKEVYELEKGDILSISLMHGFPWGDTSHAGATVVVVSDNAMKKSKELAKKLAHKWFDLRGTSESKFLDVDTALDRAQGQNQGPVVIADVSDNPGGGAAGDSTFILREMLKRKINNAAIATLWDPITADFARKVGVGASLNLRVGGKVSPFSGQPVDLYGEVKAIFNHPTSPGQKKNYFDVQVDAEGLQIVLSNMRTQVVSPEVFIRMGIDPKRMKMLVVKSSQHFRAEFEPIASEIIYCDTPGSLNSDLKSIPYKKVPRPIWPLDDISPDQI